jgi:type IV pilus assembly protein PilV
MSLIEIMIALVILLIVSLALLQTALLSIRTNVKNSVRDEAVNIADAEMVQATNLPFISIASSGPMNTTRTIRASEVSYRVTRTVTVLNSDTKQITVSVLPLYTGQTVTHSITTIVRNQ